VNGERSQADWHCIRFNQKSPVAGCFFLEYRTRSNCSPIRADKVLKMTSPQTAATLVAAEKSLLTRRQPRM